MRYLLLLILFIGCNPVKQVLRDQEKLEEVAKVVVKGGWCANDSIIIVKSDTIIKVDTLVEVHTDTEIRNINDSVFVTKWKTKTINKTLTIHDTLKSYIVDNARIKLLQADSSRLFNLADDYKQQSKKRLNWIIWCLVIFIAYWFYKNKL